MQQDPMDAFVLSDMLWKEKPDLLIEIGTNSGGGAIFFAGIMREYNDNALVLTIDCNSPEFYYKQSNFYVSNLDKTSAVQYFE